MKSWTPPTDEMIGKALASVKKETDRHYFFSRLKNPLWVAPLRELGYFDDPPGLKQLPDGYVQYPHWPELEYLVAVAEEATDQVVEIILSLPRTDNPRVYDEVLTIALKLEGEKSAALLPKLIEYIELDNPFFAHRFPALLQYWAEQRNIGEALEIAKALVPFREDPRSRDKQELRNKKPKASRLILEPAPRFQQWEYQQILENGVRPLSEEEPDKMARILIDAVSSMIRLRMYPEDLEKGSDQDFSEIWCRRLDKSDRDYQDVNETLVHTLTYACEQVYERSPELIGALDQALRSHRWKLFKRLRQHLYASRPDEVTLPWIREQILGHEDYGEREHHYEFQLMIRKASEHFGAQLLNENEREKIFSAILSGPSKESFREWMGERYSEELFGKRQRYFHRMQLRPFADLLSVDTKKYFHALEVEDQAEEITDESYFSFGMGVSGAVSYRSPKTIEELEKLTDQEILAYLNDWDESYYDKDDPLVKVNISALADVFKTQFKDFIVQDEKRLNFWMGNRARIARPVYVVSMLKAISELIKEKKFDKLDQWIEFSEWVLRHDDKAREEGQPEPGDESVERPDWASSRRAVVDLIDTCVQADVDAPLTARAGIASLLQQVCFQFDWRLDGNHPVILNRDDPVTEAINNTRSRALESLVNFGFWVRRQLPADSVPEVTDILSARTAEHAEVPLTRPEHALLGVHFGHLCILNRDWTVRYREAVFPQTNPSVWKAAFDSHIRFSRPAKATFDVLRDDFRHAIDNLDIFVQENGDNHEIVDRLGQFVFTFFLWDIYPLTGEESLLEHFYEKTADDRERWGRLFNYVGRSLSDSGRQLDEVLVGRALAYFDWRFEAAEPQELQEFTFWLQAECFNSYWRLQSYSKILSLGGVNNIGLFLQVSALKKLLQTDLALVVECFAKITDTLDQSSQMYIRAEEAKPILEAGLASDVLQAKEDAMRARENLLKLGRFDFWDND